MPSATGILVCVSNNVLLPDSETPRPATVVVDRATGKITQVILSKAPRSSFPQDAGWIDAGDKYVLPGLVEYVLPTPVIA